MQSDPLLSEFATIVIDEFHERSIHADVAIALAKQAWRARADLRIAVMSATLDSRAVSAFFDDCPVIEVPGRPYPLDVGYAPGEPIGDAAADVLRATDGQLLCFLPGAAEIGRAIAEIERRIPAGVEIVALHGSLDAADQDRALAPASGRRIVVATNIAETSLTVPGVTAVIDTGLHKVARYDRHRGIDSLETERITADAAEQRAGRAGRLAPGRVRRLWDARDRLRPHREPEIYRIDLSGAALDVIAWGGDPRTLEWFERPREDALDAALSLLARLGLTTIAPMRLTAIGEKARHLAMHPRLARIVVAGGGARALVQACQFLTDRHRLTPRTAATTSDLLSIVDDSGITDADFRRAILSPACSFHPEPARSSVARAVFTTVSSSSPLTYPMSMLRRTFGPAIWRGAFGRAMGRGAFSRAIRSSASRAALSASGSSRPRRTWCIGSTRSLGP